MAHAQKPDFVFRRNGRVHLNRRGASVQSTTGSRGVRISGNIVGYTMFRGSVKSTGYPLHSPVSPLRSLPWVTVCHHVSTGVYIHWNNTRFTVVTSAGQPTNKISAGHYGIKSDWNQALQSRTLGTLWRSWSRHCATSRKVAGPIPGGVGEIFHLRNPSGHTIALDLTQPLTEMSTINHLTPNVNYSGRTAPLNSEVSFYICIQQI